jgi:hypothetical protein
MHCTVGEASIFSYFFRKIHVCRFAGHPVNCMRMRKL